MKLTSTIRFVFVCILAFGFVGQLVAQTLSLEALGRQGPYQVASFTQLPTVPEFGDAASHSIFLPTRRRVSVVCLSLRDSLRDKRTSVGGVIIWLPMDLR